MLRFFRGTAPGTIFLIAITLIGLWISAFIDPQLPRSDIYETNPMPLYSLFRLVALNSPGAGVAASFILLSLMMFLLVNFNTSHFFISERTFLPSLIYLFFCSLFPQYQVMNPVLPAALFLMLAIMRIIGSYRKAGVASNYFDAGVLISIGTLFYANLIWFGILLIIGIALLRTGSPGEILIAITGLLTPFIITAGLYYVTGMNLHLLVWDLKENLVGSSADFEFHRVTIVVLICFAMVLAASLFFLIMHINSKKIKSRKTFWLLLWTFIISLLLYFLSPAVSVEMMWIMSIPASYLVVHFFVFSTRKVITEIIFSVMLLLVFLVQILYMV
jgi:hypothetical protein